MTTDLLKTENIGPSNLHIIVATDAVTVVRRANATALDFQDKYPNFTTALGPMDADGVRDTFENEWPDILVTHHDTIRSFITASATTTAANAETAELRLLIISGPP